MGDDVGHECYGEQLQRRWPHHSLFANTNGRVEEDEIRKKAKAPEFGQQLQGPLPL